MKRFIQTTLTAFLVLGLFSTAFSQIGTDNATTDANASVEAPINVTSGNTIEYGTLTTGDNDGSNSPTQAGNFTVGGTEGANVALSFSKSDLTHDDSGDGNRTIVLNLDEADNGAWEDSESDFSSAGNNFNLDSGTNATLPADGDIIVWTNPTITLDGNEVPGTYQGSVTLEAAYN